MLPRLLIIDDLFGRAVRARRNEERVALCGEYLIRDITEDDCGSLGGRTTIVHQPIAEAVFCRGQLPVCAESGDVVANDLSGTLKRVREGWFVQAGVPRWSMVLLDLCFYTGRVTQASDVAMPGMPEGQPGDDNPNLYFGLDLLRAIHGEIPELPVVMLSSKPRDHVVQEYSRGGALGFLPRGEAQSHELLRDFIWRHALLPDASGEIVGESIPLLMVLRAARRAAPSRQHVLIEGERGSGKELIARYLHVQSRDATQSPFVSVDSGALSPELYASELFGHVRGAFTGADRERRGRLLEADGGDLFLDEIGNMPADVQIGLLRAIETREVMPVGGSSSRRVDVRILAATNEDLVEETERPKGFRADLLDRLREGGTILLPPLRDRVEDIAALTERFLREAERIFSGIRRRIEPDALDLLRAHTWPGNVRELRACIYDAVRNHTDLELLTPRHLRITRSSSGTSNLETSGTRAYRPMRDSKLRPTQPTASSVEEFIAILERTGLASTKPEDLVGALPRIEASVARLLASLLATALRTHLRHTVDAPEGRLQVLPALALLTGDRTLSASKAYDLVIKLRHMSVETASAWDEDPILRQAYERAISKRRRRSRRRGQSTVSATRLNTKGSSS